MPISAAVTYGHNDFGQLICDEQTGAWLFNFLNIAVHDWFGRIPPSPSDYHFFSEHMWIMQVTQPRRTAWEVIETMALTRDQDPHEISSHILDSWPLFTEIYRPGYLAWTLDDLEMVIKTKGVL